MKTEDTRCLFLHDDPTAGKQWNHSAHSVCSLGLFSLLITRRKRGQSRRWGGEREETRVRMDKSKAGNTNTLSCRALRFCNTHSSKFSLSNPVASKVSHLWPIKSLHKTNKKTSWTPGWLKQVKMPAAKPDMSSVPGTHGAEGKDQLFQQISVPVHSLDT